jgi:hypothetical protein
MKVFIDKEIKKPGFNVGEYEVVPSVFTPSHFTRKKCPEEIRKLVFARLKKPAFREPIDFLNIEFRTEIPHTPEPKIEVVNGRERLLNPDYDYRVYFPSNPVFDGEYEQSLGLFYHLIPPDTRVYYFVSFYRDAHILLVNESDAEGFKDYLKSKGISVSNEPSATQTRLNC